MRLMLLGAPGAGKGTQANFLVKQFNITHISTGDMLRLAIKEGSDLGKEAKAYMDAGQLVPDSLIIALVKERLSQPDLANGFLLDGFPRTLSQAQALTQAGIQLDAVVEIDVPDSSIVRRITGRRVHPGSNRVYHIEFYPPKVAGHDDETGEPLVQRQDDKEETVLKRLAVYHKDTAPVIAYYKQLSQQEAERCHYFSISGVGDAAKISQHLYEKLTEIQTSHGEHNADNYPG